MPRPPARGHPAPTPALRRNGCPKREPGHPLPCARPAASGKGAAALLTLRRGRALPGPSPGPRVLPPRAFDRALPPPPAPSENRPRRPAAPAAAPKRRRPRSAAQRARRRRAPRPQPPSPRGGRGRRRAPSPPHLEVMAAEQRTRSLRSHRAW